MAIVILVIRHSYTNTGCRPKLVDINTKKYFVTFFISNQVIISSLHQFKFVNTIQYVKLIVSNIRFLSLVVLIRSSSINRTIDGANPSKIYFLTPFWKHHAWTHFISPGSYTEASYRFSAIRTGAQIRVICLNLFEWKIVAIVQLSIKEEQERIWQ